jgi:hypothetical protein
MSNDFDSFGSHIREGSIMNTAIAQQEVKFEEGDIATWEESTGIIREIYHDDEGKVCISLEGEDFGEHEVVYQDDLVAGGTLKPYAPTLESQSKIPNAYAIEKIEKSDGLIPAGWRVEYTPDGVYVGWGFETKQTAIIYANAHMAGIHYFGSKM